MGREKEYIGDGVYVRFDGFAVILTVEDDDINVLERIDLEPEVLRKLNSYIAKVADAK